MTTQTTPNAKPAPESYDEKFDRMKKRKEERETKTTKCPDDGHGSSTSQTADEVADVSATMLAGHSHTTEPSEWSTNKANELARHFRFNPNGMIDNASIRFLAASLDEVLREGEVIAYAKRNIKL